MPVDHKVINSIWYQPHIIQRSVKKSDQSVFRNHPISSITHLSTLYVEITLRPAIIYEKHLGLVATGKIREHISNLSLETPAGRNWGKFKGWLTAHPLTADTKLCRSFFLIYVYINFFLGDIRNDIQESLSWNTRSLKNGQLLRRCRTAPNFELRASED